MAAIAAIAADAALVLHLAFIAFTLFGGLLLLRRPRLAWLHVPVLSWGVWIEAGHGLCPLTTIENALRNAAGHGGYPDSFITHYLVPLIYPPGLDAGQQRLLAFVFAIWSLAIYSLVWRRLRRARAPLL